MAKILILEGPRLTGKSTVARELRNRVNYATLINPTGFPDDGDKGLAKIATYYEQWVNFLEAFKHTDTLFIFDRFMFSEVVFSKLYKNYDFTPYYNKFLSQLTDGGHEIEFLMFDIQNDEELMRRAMNRNKALFAEVEESVQELKKQRQGYRDMAQNLLDRYYVHQKLPHFTNRRWVVDKDTTEDLVKEIINTIIENGFDATK